MMRTLPDRVGMTSSIPVEVLYAAGCIPCDLNNLFISHTNPGQFVETAERLGMPRNTCTWVKGLYSIILQENFKVVIGVVQGDCRHAISMLETLLPRGLDMIPFSYPYEKGRQLLRWEIQKMMDRFGVQWDDVHETKAQLDGIRKLVFEIDRRTWQNLEFIGKENLEALVNCSDFKGNPKAFRQELKAMLSAPIKPHHPPRLRLGLLGVPGVFTDLYGYMEKQGVYVIYHEVARQMAMPGYTSKDLLDQYLSYTYPYSVLGRIQDILEQTQVRQLDGYIHYVQAFCHHQIEDTVFRQKLPLPVLTLEGDKVGPLDGRTRTRVDAFIHMLEQKKRRHND